MAARAEVNLIEQTNPEWVDLYETLLDRLWVWIPGSSLRLGPGMIVNLRPGSTAPRRRGLRR